jgi:hypothetical protein
VLIRLLKGAAKLLPNSQRASKIIQTLLLEARYEGLPGSTPHSGGTQEFGWRRGLLVGKKKLACS